MQRKSQRSVTYTRTSVIARPNGSISGPLWATARSSSSAEAVSPFAIVLPARRILRVRACYIGLARENGHNVYVAAKSAPPEAACRLLSRRGVVQRPGGGEVGQGEGACAGCCAIGGGAVAAVGCAAAFGVGLAATFFLWTGFLAGFAGGGTGDSSTSTGLGRNSEVPSPIATKSSFSLSAW